MNLTLSPHRAVQQSSFIGEFNPELVRRDIAFIEAKLSSKTTTVITDDLPPPPSPPETSSSNLQLHRPPRLLAMQKRFDTVHRRSLPPPPPAPSPEPLTTTALRKHDSALNQCKEVSEYIEETMVRGRAQDVKIVTRNREALLAVGPRRRSEDGYDEAAVNGGINNNNKPWTLANYLRARYGIVLLDDNNNNNNNSDSNMLVVSQEAWKKREQSPTQPKAKAPTNIISRKPTSPPPPTNPKQQKQQEKKQPNPRRIVEKRARSNESNNNNNNSSNNN
eukprot:PhM_4_TR18064/c2_g1_i1/m.101903